jgi:hypothetical protein
MGVVDGLHHVISMHCGLIYFADSAIARAAQIGPLNRSSHYMYRMLFVADQHPLIFPL